MLFVELNFSVLWQPERLSEIRSAVLKRAVQVFAYRREIVTPIRKVEIQ